MSKKSGPGVTLADVECLRQALLRAGGMSLELETAGFRLKLVPQALLDNGAQAETPQASNALSTIDSDGPGLFRMSDPTGGPPFVTEGKQIEKGQIVALIEVGSALMPLHATQGGRAEQILVKDGDLVGYGTPVIALAG